MALIVGDLSGCPGTLRTCPSAPKETIRLWDRINGDLDLVQALRAHPQWPDARVLGLVAKVFAADAGHGRAGSSADETSTP